MTVVTGVPDERESSIRRRNRRLAAILILVMLGMAAWGTLYLRHYGFNTDPHSERYH
jgi:hypothetical protein